MGKPLDNLCLLQLSEIMEQAFETFEEKKKNMLLQWNLYFQYKNLIYAENLK